jgi:hypothetical protein
MAARYTYDQLLQQIAAHKAAGMIWNQEHETLKYNIAAAFEAERNEFKSGDYMEIVRNSEDRESAENQLYWAYPFEARHAGAGLKKIAKLDTTNKYVAAFIVLMNRWKALADAQAELKPLIVKGRKPSTEPSKTPPRTLDHTGTCAICGRNVKLSEGGKIVAHGYTIRYGWQQGNCFGVGYDPIEVSPEGLYGALKSLVGVIERTTDAIIEVEEDKREEYPDYSAGTNMYGGALKQAKRGEPNFERARERTLNKLRSDLKRMFQDEKDWNRAITEWKPRTLPGERK